MKNVKFFSGLLIGIIVGVCIMALIKCKSDSSVQEQQVSNSVTMLEDIERLGGPEVNLGQPDVYKLMVDNIQYVVVSKSNAIAIVRHK
jgi:hypothetical protein